MIPEDASPRQPAAEQKPSHLGWKAVLPAAAFLGGFLWDVFTVGRRIGSLDLVLMVGYFVAAAAILFLMARGVRFRGSSKLNLALQFLFGGMFSPLVVLYFLSSGDRWGILVVLGLAAMLVVNEFLGERYHRLSISWAVFGVCGVMLLNFVLPHVMRSIHPGWFYASLAVSTGLVAGLKQVSRERDAKLWPVFGVAALLGLLHFFNVIPPVPIVSRALVIGSEVGRENGDFVVKGRTVPGTFFGRSEGVVLEDGDAAYCFSSVFVPTGIDTVITHRWMRFDGKTGEWLVTDRIPFRVIGGRFGGYRGYTFKRNVQEGDWRIVVESEAGDVIASTRFRVKSGGKPGRSFERHF